MKSKSFGLFFRFWSNIKIDNDQLNGNVNAFFTLPVPRNDRDLGVQSPRIYFRPSNDCHRI